MIKFFASQRKKRRNKQMFSLSDFVAFEEFMEGRIKEAADKARKKKEDGYWYNHKFSLVQMLLLTAMLGLPMTFLEWVLMHRIVQSLGLQ